MATRRFRIARRLSQEALIDLYELDVTRHGGPVLRWTPGPLGAESTNQIENPCLRNNAAGWENWSTVGLATNFGSGAGGATRTLAEFGSGWVRCVGTFAVGQLLRAAYRVGGSASTASWVRVQPGQVWEFQARVAPIRMAARATLHWYTAAGAWIADTLGNAVVNAGGDPDHTTLSRYTLSRVQGVAPATAAFVIPSVSGTAPGGSSVSDPAISFSLCMLAHRPNGLSTIPLFYSEGLGRGAVKFGGATYAPLPIMIEGTRLSGKGAQPRPRVTLPDVDTQITQLLVSYKSLIRCKVSRKRVYARSLDDGPEADSTDFFGPEVWYVDRVAHWLPGETVELELGNILDIEGVQVPRFQAIRDVCTHTYRTWSGSAWQQGTCPYSGASMYTAADAVTMTPSEDLCSRRMGGCVKRHPAATDVLPFRGFPGLGRPRT